MNRAYFVCLFLCLTTTFLLSQSNPVSLINQSAIVASPISASQADPKAQAKILGSYGKLPLSFEANHGQTDKRVKFLSPTSGYTLFLTGDEAVRALSGTKINEAKIAGAAQPSGLSSHKGHESSATAAGQHGLASLPVAAQGPISAALGRDDSRYRLQANGGSFHAENPQHNLSLNFTRQGVEVRNKDARWGLALRGYGYGNDLRAVRGVAPQAKANRVEYRRGALTEWYINGPIGLEQGFTLAQRPGKANARPLTVALVLASDAKAELEADGKALTLKGRDGQAALRFAGLVAYDATGRALRGWFALHGGELLLEVEDAGARYPLVVDPFVQQAELTASDGVYDDAFGASVALSSDGNTALVGACDKTVGSNPYQGAAYVFSRLRGSWSQQQKLTAPNGEQEDQFGFSVALSDDGKTALVAANFKKVGSNDGQGAAYVFASASGSWSLQQELTASDGAASDYFGWSVALSGDRNTALVGSPGWNDYQGAAYVFTSASGSWSLQQELTASDGADFGSSVALSSDGTTALIGSLGWNDSQGAAYVFTSASGSWSLHQELTASDGAAGDNFGSSVALVSDGKIALVGAYDHNQGAGAAYVFTSASRSWSQQQELTASQGYALFGGAVSLSGDGSTALVGSTGWNDSQGAAYVFAQVTFASLIKLVEQFDTKRDVAAIMVFTLELAQWAESVHAAKLADALLDAFIDEVTEQSGKSLTAAQAAILIQDAKALMMPT